MVRKQFWTKKLDFLQCFKLFFFKTVKLGDSDRTIYKIVKKGKINNKYPRLNIHHLSEIKCPKFVEYINNKRKKQNNNNYSNNYNERYYQNKIKNTAYYYKKLSQNSFNFANKNKNLSQKKPQMKKVK